MRAVCILYLVYFRFDLTELIMPMILTVYSNGPFTQWAGLVSRAWLSCSTKYYDLGRPISHLFVVQIHLPNYTSAQPSS